MGEAKNIRNVSAAEMQRRLPLAELKRLVAYRPQTGLLFWKYHPSVLKRLQGQPALTTQRPDGSLFGRVCGVQVLAHRAAWALQTGTWPDGGVSHLNGNRSDNRFLNLACASHSEHMRRSVTQRSRRDGSPVVGVGINRKGCFYARIRDQGEEIGLGVFDRVSDAVAARLDAERAFGWPARPRSDAELKAEAEAWAARLRSDRRARHGR